jgi:hypothetical protein
VLHKIRQVLKDKGHMFSLIQNLELICIFKCTKTCNWGTIWERWDGKGRRRMLGGSKAKIHCVNVWRWQVLEHGGEDGEERENWSE